MRVVTKFVLIGYLRTLCDLTLLGSICGGFIFVLWLVNGWTDGFERTVGWASIVAAIALGAGVFTYLIIALSDAESRLAEDLTAVRSSRR